jgi:hypothetical protein
MIGCTVVGPSAVRNGRLTYNEAINETNNQQLLKAIVQNRYDESASLLAVASVTANVSVTASTGIQVGVGDSDNYEGNLVPLTVGGAYEENPTISYIPVAGARYAEQVFSPVPLVVLVQLTGSLADPAYVYSALVSGANGIQNPDFLFSHTSPDPRFGRLVAILTTLTQANRLHWVTAPERAGQYSIVVDHYAPEYASDVDEFIELLGLPRPAEADLQLVVPVYLALDGRRSGGIGITTRSVGDLIEMLSAAIDVPDEDQQSGFAASFPPLGPAGQDLRVRFSESRPENAAVAVPYRGGWFFIDDADQPTKRFFRLMSALWSVTIADSTAHAASAPVLTVPVSR